MLKEEDPKANLVPSPIVKLHTNSLELSLLQFLPLNYYHSHFLAATFDFTSFFTLEFWGRTLYSKLTVFVYIEAYIVMVQTDITQHLNFSESYMRKDGHQTKFEYAD